MIRQWVLTVGLLAMSVAAFAQTDVRTPQVTTGVYAGGAVGKSRGTLKLTDDFYGDLVNGSDDDFGVKVYGGYQFNPHIGAEIAYTNLGTLGGDLGGGVGVKFKPHLFSGSLVLSAPLEHGLGVFGRVGYAFWKLDSTLTDSFGGNQQDTLDESGLLWGIGGSYAFSSSALRLEYEQSEITDDDGTTHAKITGKLISLGFVQYF